jgi:uncharacterized membrane protein
MTRTLLLSLVGLLVLVAVALAFYIVVGQHAAISQSPADWATFGEYFGGTAGPLLAFVTVVLIVYTVYQQSLQIDDARRENQKRDLLLYVSRADEEIERCLKRKLHAEHNPTEVEFGDIVWGAVAHTYVNKREFEASITRLHKLICQFSLAIALYRDNVDTYFVFRHYRDKALELIAFLEQHLNQLQSMAGPSLAICKGHLEFEHVA